MVKAFKSVLNHSPGRSVHDLSYRKLFTGDMGKLYPILHDEMVPGDRFKIGAELVIRFQPLVAPILHEINAYVHYFFYPYRLLWPEPNGWETFISGGASGQDASHIPVMGNGMYSAANSLCDYLGLPLGLNYENVYENQPTQWPYRAYYKCWNEYYRDETLQTEIDPGDLTKDVILNRNWKKDYLTSALPFQQRGIAPALPVTGIIPVVFSGGGFEDGDPIGGLDTTTLPGGVTMATVSAYATHLSNMAGAVDLSLASSFDIADFRLAFQVQKWMERNARSGIRYKEFLEAHFGVTVPDSRIQRGEYLGGMKVPVIVSEVLQTSQTTTGTGSSPQGNMSGHAIAVDKEFCADYTACEFGIVIGMLSIMPEPTYNSQGINRQWLRHSRYDHYFPEFANLSEQAILQREIFTVNSNNTNNTPFGFQGRYDEMRYKPSIVCSGMRDDFVQWHLARIFESAPTLTDEFIQCVPDKRIFAVPSEHGLIINFQNIIKAIRPIPILAEPGLIDHN